MSLKTYRIGKTGYWFCLDPPVLVKALEGSELDKFHRSNGLNFDRANQNKDHPFAYNNLMARGNQLANRLQEHINDSANAPRHELLKTAFRHFSGIDPESHPDTYSPTFEVKGTHALPKKQQERVFHPEKDQKVKAGELAKAHYNGKVSSKQFHKSLEKTYGPLLDNNDTAQRIKEIHGAESFRQELMNRHDNQKRFLKHAKTDLSQHEGHRKQLEKLGKNVTNIHPQQTSQLEDNLHNFAQMVGGHRLTNFSGFMADQNKPSGYAISADNMSKQKIPLSGVVSLGGNGRMYPHTVWHELGHHLEFGSPQLQASAREFLRQRGESVKHINELTGRNLKPENSDHYGVSDRFHSPYVGRFYKDGSTEVVSTGMEHLHSAESLLHLRDSDPNHLSFTLGSAVSQAPKSK